MAVSFPGHPYSKRITFHHRFRIPKPKDGCKAKKPKPKRVGPTPEEHAEARREEYASQRSKTPEAREADRNRKRQRREERAAAGLCYRCPAPAVPGKAYCEPCHTIILERNAGYRKASSQSPEWRENRNLQEKKYRQERKAAGICENCSNKAIPGQNHCEVCRDKRRASWQRYKAKRRAES